jgi:FkbM family methyltransferase
VRENTKSDSYEALMWDVITNVHRYIPRLGDKVLDLGAHFGMFSLYCAARGCLVTALEPTYTSFIELEGNARVAREIARGEINPQQVAVWDSDGMVLLSIDPTTTAANYVVGDRGEGVPVHAVSLAGLLNMQDWDCVKMDIEGAEHRVLMNTHPDKLQRIKFLTVEIHNNLLAREQCVELRQRLTSIYSQVESLPVIVEGKPTDQDSALYCWR